LGLLIAEWLLEKFPTEAEGALSQRLSALVRRESLSVVALELDLGQHLHLSPGEENCGGRSNQSILADACEAVIGALYLDGGLDQARRFVRRYWAGLIERIERPPQDHKTRLQEWAQSRGHPLPVYRILSHTGPAHRPEFVIAVEVSGFPPAEGIGGSRRAAEQAAAAILLERHAPSPFFQALDHAPRR
jgi:ribonuclease-3